MSMLIRLLALGLCYWSCTERPTQSATPSRSAVRAKLVAQPNTYVVSHGGEEVFRLEALKWRGGRQGAVSLTYDAPWGVDPVFELATDAVMARGLAMDLEIVSTKLQHFKRLPIIERMYRELIPNGIGFFGHGHGHVYHDSLGYTQAYESFRTNFELMEKWGLKPKAYGYPHWSGIQASTQAANRQAGFIAARGGLRRPPRRADFYICSGDVREPDNWFYLPSVIMGAKDGTDIPHHDALIQLLEEALEADAWIILTYHSIGNPEGWGYYPFPEFERDLDYIAAADFWSGNLDAVSAYIQERNALDVKIVRYFGIGTPSQYELTIGDGLDNAVYDEPLTFELSFNPELNVREVHIDPPVDGASSFVVADDRLRLDIVPDERRYALVLERSH